MIETNPFAQGEIRSEMSETASENPEANAPEMVENDLLAVEYHLEHNYQFRRNVLSGLVEYKKTGEPDESFSRLTSEALNTIFIKAKREIPDDTSLKTDIKAYVESDIPPVYNPVVAWLDSLAKWDGKDRVAEFLNRIPGLSDEKIDFLRIYLRSNVAHWLNMEQEHGNETVPLLIGNQGCGKSTFCVRFLPKHLRQYYLDHFNLANKFDKEMALSSCLLICLDEIDMYNARQMAQIKQALSKVKVNGRKIYGKTIDERMRFASFIATTNNRHPLVDKTGSRRFLTIEIPNGEVINNNGEIEYEQLYAQLLHEVRDEKLRYWYTNEETQRIQELNAPYEQTLDLEQMIDCIFRKPQGNEKHEAFTSLDIRKILKQQYPDVADSQLNSIKIGKAMKEMKVARVKSKRGVSYSLVQLAA
jgi:predicted P-loop ATPase